MDTTKKPRYGAVPSVELIEGSHSSVIDAALVDVDSTEISSVWIYSNFIGCLIVGPLNFVSYKVMYAAFGPSHAFFVSQGVNFLYVLYGGVILHFLTQKGEITKEMRAIPHTKFIVMGFLDCLGGFLAAMGANNTPGSLQQLLNQTLIPITMLFSYIFLGRSSTILQVFGSMLIVLGAWTAGGDDPDSPSSTNYTSFSSLLYFLSNVPIAFSCIYKEMGFRNLQVPRPYH